ncbi:MAG: hypothetical protein HY271_03435 [Deltaproteobacteria bacterium]|nr:hypothetical protein [Deltaproteobacteria bacterium]
MPALLALILALLSAVPAAAAERTFIFSPADLVHMIDTFNGGILAQSSSLGRHVSIRGDQVRFFGRSCPSLSSGYAVSRIRVLDFAGRAALLTGRQPNFAFGLALQSMGVTTWSPPATGRTHQPSWVVETPVSGAVGFATAGFASGDPTGAIDAAAIADATPSFLVQVDLTSDVTDGPASLVVALTTELPSARPGKMSKRSECLLVGSAYPADAQALVDLLAVTSLSDTTRSYLASYLDDVLRWTGANQPPRAARAARRFAFEVADRPGAEIAADAAEKLVIRALLVNNALGF